MMGIGTPTSHKRIPLPMTHLLHLVDFERVRNPRAAAAVPARVSQPAAAKLAR